MTHFCEWSPKKCRTGYLRVNGKAEPLRSPGEFPKQGDDHGKFQRHFSIDDEVQWSLDDNIKKDRPRHFVGTFWLLSDVPTYELLNYSRVNLRIQNKMELEVKPLQSFMTKVGYMVLGMHANVNTLDVFTEFRNALVKIEKNMFEEKRFFGSNAMQTDLPFDRRFRALDDLWKQLPFPEIVTVRLFLHVNSSMATPNPGTFSHKTVQIIN
jgi:hypothetical protein